MIFIALLILHHPLYMVVHSLVFFVADIQLVDCAICCAVEGVNKVFADKAGNERIMHFFAAKAVYFVQSAVKGNRSMIQFSFCEPLNNPAKGGPRSG
ncbi:hypothetical protein D3C81_1681300 [compost metagenome]